MRKFYAFSSFLLALLSGAYVFILLLPDVVRLMTKQGWDDRPLIFFNIESVITYIVFALCSLIFSYEIYKKSKTNITTSSFLVLSFSLLFYWLLFLFNIGAVSSV